ncbi:MAG: Plug domain-containing protein, partial [Bacteroidota bacterium]
ETPDIIVDATPRINPEETGMTSIGADEIEHHPQRKDIISFISTMSPDIKTDDQGQLYVRGARPTAIVYFVDGMKIYGRFRNLPSSGIGSVSVYTGGVPAKYGDTTGGVVVIESKNYFDLYNQWKYSN